MMTSPEAGTARPQGGEINISMAITEIIAEITSRVPSFGHIDTGKIQVCISSNRNNGRGATFGKLVPLRFKGGEELLYFRGKCYAMPRVFQNGTRLLYLVYFYSPRFIDLPPREKLRVIFHELYHISPEFNGDIRRFGRGGSAHGNSKKRYDLRFEKEMAEFMDHISSTRHWHFLSLDARALFSNYRKVFSHRMKTPRPAVIA
jgi:hypothetical protein